MVTKNFKSLLAAVLTASNVTVVDNTNKAPLGTLPIRDVTGVRRYAHSNTEQTYPAYRSHSFVTNPNAIGISIGSGSTPADEEDYQLENTITENVSVNIPLISYDQEDGCPVLRFQITITNTGHEDLYVNEVGFKQAIRGARSPSRHENAQYVCLLDRTVLDDPLVISPGLAGVLNYTLKTIPRKEKYVNGIKIVDFAFGTDEEISAIIDAAWAGTIDLQRDAGWRVGDTRKIKIQSFISCIDDNTEQPYQDIDIIISSFSDYNNSGCLMQIDFFETLSAPNRMHRDANVDGGYGATEMYDTTLPNLVTSLPQWLGDRLMEFDVLALSDDNETLETIHGNKLALRSESEYTGKHDTCGFDEGEQVDLYKCAYPKLQGYDGGATTFWLRSHYRSAYMLGGWYNGWYSVSNRNPGHNNKTYKYGIAPFGCIKGVT